MCGPGLFDHQATRLFHVDERSRAGKIRPRIGLNRADNRVDQIVPSRRLRRTECSAAWIGDVPARNPPARQPAAKSLRDLNVDAKEATAFGISCSVVRSLFTNISTESTMKQV